MTDKPKNQTGIPGVVVYARGKKWSYRLELERDPLTDERHFEYGHGFATYDEALTAAIKAKASHANGQRVTPAKRTVTEFMTEWVDTVRDSIKPSTHANYVDYQDAYVLPIIGKRRLQEVDVPMLNALYRHLLSQGRCRPDTNSAMYDYWSTRRKAGVEPKPNEIAKHCQVSIHAARAAVLRYRRGRLPVAKSPGLATKTVKNVHRMLHRALADAVAWRYIEYNPAEHAALPRERRKGPRQRGRRGHRSSCPRGSGSRWRTGTPRCGSWPPPRGCDGPNWPAPSVTYSTSTRRRSNWPTRASWWTARPRTPMASRRAAGERSPSIH